MIVVFNATGSQRKALADALGEIIGAEKKYQGVPSCAYRVGEYTIDREGNIEADCIKEDIIDAIKERGFFPVDPPQEATVCEENEIAKVEPQEEVKPDTGADSGTEITIPADGFSEIALRNLENLIKSKNTLICRALGFDRVRLQMRGGELKFDWLQEDVSDAEREVVKIFIDKLCEQAKKAKRCNAKEKEIVNEKYEFRCFLLRIGFVGSEYKYARKILLSRLEGSAAFKNGKPANNNAEEENENTIESTC